MLDFANLFQYQRKHLVRYRRFEAVAFVERLLHLLRRLAVRRSAAGSHGIDYSAVVDYFVWDFDSHASDGVNSGSLNARSTMFIT